MACLEGICGEGVPKAVIRVTETIRAASLVVESKETAKRVKLLHAEMMFTKVPLSAAAYPAFSLKRCDVDVLKTSLAAALAAHPMLAGRLFKDEVALTNDGVPFTVCDDLCVHAPEEFEEEMLLGLADFRQPPRVRRGLEPLITVRLTRFRDGSAVLAVCRSHALLDGTSAWTFINNWAAAARGQQIKARSTSEDRQAVWSLVPSDEEVDELAQDVFGKKLTKGWKGWAMEYMIPPVAAIWDSLFLSGVAFPNRPRLFLSDAEVSRIKAAATPAPGSAGDGWVSTQEALAAYILLTVSKVLLPARSKGRALLVLLLDTRRALGLPESTCMGCGLTMVGLQVKGILQMELADVANELHEAAKTETSPERLRKKWLLLAGLGEQDMAFEAMNDLMKLRMNSDITLQLNNQSKRKVPDFGADGSGGPAQAVCTNAGPTLMLPAEGGIEVLFCSSFLGSSSGKRVARALGALRAEIPEEGVAGPTLLGAKVEGEKSPGTTLALGAPACDIGVTPTVVGEPGPGEVCQRIARICTV